MAEAPSFTGEVRMLIDGELVEARLGQAVREHQPGHRGGARPGRRRRRRPTCDRAIAAARRAFDETDWSTNRALRKRCLEQLQEALEAEREELREELIAEVGTPGHGDVQRRSSTPRSRTACATRRR